MRRLPALSVAICLAGGICFAASQAAVGRPVPGPTPAAGSASSPPPPPPIAAGTALVLGRVVEAGSSTAVANATVLLSGPALGPQTAVFTDGVAGGPRTVEADGQGRFLFRDLPAGTYSLDVRAAGFAPGAYGETRVITIRRTLDLIRRLDVAEGEKPNVTIQLWKTGGISGAVIDELGEPVVGALINVFARMTDWGGPIMQSAASAITDDRGMYHVDVVPGDYVVGLLAATTTVPAAAVDEFLKATGEGGPAQQAYLQSTIGSGGVLPRGIGVRYGDLLVSQINARNVPAVPPPALAGGQPAFYPSTYHPSTWSALSASVVTLASGEEKTAIDIHLRRAPLMRVSGRVTGPNGPAAGLALRLIANDPAVMRTSPATLLDTPRAVTDRNGQFVFIGLAPGPYMLHALQQTPGPAGALAWAAETLTVGNTDISDAHLTLQGGGRVTGRVVVEGASPPPAGAIRGMVINARPLPGAVASIGTTSRFQGLDESFHFTTAQLVPGPYMMTVAGVPPGWVLKSVTAGGQNVVDQAFDVPAAGVSDVIVTIADQISTVSGFARDGDGKPAAAATIVVFPTNKALWRLPGMASRRVQTAAPGRDGRYAFRGLPSGEYFVIAAEWPSADFSDGRVLTTLIPSASRVILSDGGSQTQDLRVVTVK